MSAQHPNAESWHGRPPAWNRDPRRHAVEIADFAARCALHESIDWAADPLLRVIWPWLGDATDEASPGWLSPGVLSWAARLDDRCVDPATTPRPADTRISDAQPLPRLLPETLLWRCSAVRWSTAGRTEVWPARVVGWEVLADGPHHLVVTPCPPREAWRRVARLTIRGTMFTRDRLGARAGMHLAWRVVRQLLGRAEGTPCDEVAAALLRADVVAYPTRTPWFFAEGFDDCLGFHHRDGQHAALIAWSDSD